MSDAAGARKLTKQDFVSAQEVRWCPGCGDYAVLAVLQKTLADMGLPPHKHVFVSGIGCSSRLPYYVSTYGFHSIHGRAPTLATGVKSFNPDLTVWVITGDGDGLSIGGNHFLHTLRRNTDLKIIFFNNRIYGLTKGQYSPTSEFGKKTKSSPHGTVDYPVNPVSVALGSEGTFIARTLDADTLHMSVILKRAAEHKGTAFVEVYQNCVIFNNDAFQKVTDRQERFENALYLEQGKPLLFGKDKNKGIRMNPKTLQPEIVAVGGEKGVPIEEILVHDETRNPSGYAYMLSQMDLPMFPIPFGIFRAIRKPTHDELMIQQIKDAKKKFGEGDINKLLAGPETWEVK